jgi:hypothetical protein
MKAAEFFYGSSFTSADRPEPKPDPKPITHKHLAETYMSQPCERCGNHWRLGNECAACFRPGR